MTTLSNQHKIIIITAPSGSGKTTLVKRLLAATGELSFSISACTRSPRQGEVHGVDYYFFSEDRFKQLIDEDAFVEWEMVYAGKYYGTLKTEMQRIWETGKYPIVDIDVRGALTVMNKYRGHCLTIFIKTPSIDELRRRLAARGTETPQTLEERVIKAEDELTFIHEFDKVIVNDDLDTAATELIQVVKEFLQA
ncbi:guanylate kinase [Nemorincola caseinilytica]|uniref:Guanylate kinase n=2 Tax=Nemorincola caseinilytica TaxID=2054315 RepID=A0ABP8NP24_9BACT